MDIKGKVFIVTGGASGLGEGTARMLAAAGGTVVIADMQVEKGEATAKEIGGAFVKCDVSQEADGQAVVAKAVSLGKLMGLDNAWAYNIIKTVGNYGEIYERNLGPKGAVVIPRDGLNRLWSKGGLLYSPSVQ